MDIPPNPDQAPGGGAGPVKIKIRLSSNSSKPPSSTASPVIPPAAPAPLPPPPASLHLPAPSAQLGMPTTCSEPQASPSNYSHPSPAPAEAPRVKKARQMDFTPSPSSSPVCISAELPPPATSSYDGDVSQQPLVAHQTSTEVASSSFPVPAHQVVPPPAPLAGYLPSSSTPSQPSSHLYYPPPTSNPPSASMVSSYRSSPVPQHGGGGGSSRGGESDRGDSPEVGVHRDVPHEVLEGLTGRALVEKKRKWRKKEGVAGPGKNWRKGLKKGAEGAAPVASSASPSSSTTQSHRPAPPLSFNPPSQAQFSSSTPRSSNPSTSQYAYSRAALPPTKYSTTTYLVPDPLLNRAPFKSLRPRHWGLGRRMIKGVGGTSWCVVGWMGEGDGGLMREREKGIREKQQQQQHASAQGSYGTGGSGGGQIPLPMGWYASGAGGAGGGAEQQRSEAYYEGLRRGMAAAGGGAAVQMFSPAPLVAAVVATEGVRSGTGTPSGTVDVKMEG